MTEDRLMRATDELVESIRRIKADPNPVGEENFYFINALNEWAEGNALEPSVQWGTQWSDSLIEAIAEAESLHWRDEMVDPSDKIAGLLEKGTEDVDVCVLLRAQDTAWPFFVNSPDDVVFHPPNPVNMLDMLRSLTAQHNDRWRAVVFSTVSRLCFLLAMIHRLTKTGKRADKLWTVELKSSACSNLGIRVLPGHSSIPTYLVLRCGRTWTWSIL